MDDSLVFDGKECREFFYSLRALSSPSEIYKLMPGATVSINCLSRTEKTLGNWKWVPDNRGPSEGFKSDFLEPFRPLKLNRNSALACVAMFETGNLDIDPESLANVMAMSSGDSIYIVAPLLCDPHEVPTPTEIRRIAGNVWRAGIAMLIPPRASRVMAPNLTSWSLIKHDDFDGKPEDNFQSTSIHLSFTGYEMPLDQGTYGAQDYEAFYLETVLSVHDGEHG